MLLNYCLCLKIENDSKMLKSKGNCVLSYNFKTTLLYSLHQLRICQDGLGHPNEAVTANSNNSATSAGMLSHSSFQK